MCPLAVQTTAAFAFIDFHNSGRLRNMHSSRTRGSKPELEHTKAAINPFKFY